MGRLGLVAALLGINGLGSDEVPLLERKARGKVEGGDDLAKFLESARKRHSNPWSVWTRILSNVPVWNRSWKQGVAVVAWFIANPILFSAPEGDESNESWATRGVLGEEMWTSERPRDLSLLLNTASAAFFAGGLFATHRRRPWPMVFFATVAYLLKLWYIDRMTLYYAQQREQQEPKEDAGPSP